jgi:hypothetical protein
VGFPNAGSVSYCTEKACADAHPLWQSLLNSRKLIEAFEMSVLFVIEKEYESPAATPAGSMQSAITQPVLNIPFALFPE